METSMADVENIADDSAVIENMDSMDDLFGDGAADALAATDLGAANLNMEMQQLSGSSLPPAVVRQVAENQELGRCSRVAWSNMGLIARIGANGHQIEYHTVVRDRKTGTWSISKTAKQRSSIVDDAPSLVHIEFSGTGVDLAAFDAHGGLHLFSINGALGRMAAALGTYAEYEGIRSDLDRVVGSHWLGVYPTEFGGAWLSPGVRESDSRHWQCRINYRNPDQRVVHHPRDGKGALLHITCNAGLHLTFQQEGFGWQSVYTRLESLIGSDELLTHAAFGDDGDQVLLATHDQAQRLRLYSVQINWNMTKDTRRQGWQLSVVSPELKIRHLALTEKALANQAQAAKLSQLMILPAIPDVAEPQGSGPVTVLSLSNHAVLSADLAADPTQPPQNVFSVVSSWHVEKTKLTLHDSFGKLKGSKSSSLDLGTTTILRRQEDVVLSKLVLGIRSQYFHTILACSVSDGTVDFRDRITLQPIDGFGETTTVSSLAHNGFEYPSEEHVLHLAFSPDASMIATISTDGKCNAKTIQQKYGWLSIDDGIDQGESLVEAAVACLARQYAILSASSMSNDEVLAALPNDLEQQHRQLFVQQVIRMTHRNLDLVSQEAQSQQSAVLRDNVIAKALSAQLVLSHKLGSHERTAPGQLAWCTLNFKYIATGFFHCMSKQQDLNVAAVTSLRGCIKWHLDLMVLIVDDLLAVFRGRASHDSAKAAFEAHIRATGSPVLHLLLCALSRVLLRLTLVWLQRYYALVDQCIPRAQSVTQRQQLQESAEYVKSLPFDVQTFIRLFSDIDSQIKRLYMERKIGPARRNEIELAMLTECAIPDEMADLLETFLDGSVKEVPDKIDGGRVYFWPTTWLNLANHSAASTTARPYDVLRKTPLAEGSKVKACKRCGSVTEDLSPEKVRELPIWLQAASRNCLCTGSWTVMDDKS